MDGRGGHRIGAWGALFVLAVLPAGCGLPDLARGDDSTAGGGIRLQFEDRPDPSAFTREGNAVRAGEDSAEGLWAAVRNLPRPERGRVIDLESGASVDVALFAAPSSGPEIRLSTEASDAIGLGAGPARVRITALRSKPLIEPQ